MAESQSAMREDTKTRNGKFTMFIAWPPAVSVRKTRLWDARLGILYVRGAYEDGSTPPAGFLARTGSVPSVHLGPTRIGVELAHGSRYVGCGCAQIFLEQNTILVGDKCHHSRIAVFRRIGDEGKTADHFSVGHIIFRAALCVATLPGQHAEVVAMERQVHVGLHTVSLGSRECHQRPKRASGLALR